MANDNLGKAVVTLVAAVATAVLGPKARNNTNPRDFKGNMEASKNERKAVVEAGKNLHNTIKNK